jgi:hypothetical protein
MPMSTKFFDMRINGECRCKWDEEFVINEFAKDILNPNVVILFEILEVNEKLIIEGSKLLNADMMYPVAWAYLRPLGTARIHMQRTRLQLYKTRFNYDTITKQRKPYDWRTPDVFLDFNWAGKTKYPSYLEVDISFVAKSEEIIERRHYARAPWEREIGDPLDEEQEPHSENLMPPPHSDGMRLRRWEKFLDQPSMKPNLRVWKFDTDSQGCLKMEFSH